MIEVECTCSEDRSGGDPLDHSASCAWASTVLRPESAVLGEELVYEALRVLTNPERTDRSARNRAVEILETWSDATERTPS